MSFVMLSLIIVRQHIGTASVQRPEQYISLAVSLMNLQSSGTVSLLSKDFSDPPNLEPNFLNDPFDKRIAIEAVREAMQFLSSPALKKDHVRFAAEPKSLNDNDILVCAPCYTRSPPIPCRIPLEMLRLFFDVFLRSADSLTLATSHRTSSAKRPSACGTCVAQLPWAILTRPMRVWIVISVSEDWRVCASWT